MSLNLDHDGLTDIGDMLDKRKLVATGPTNKTPDNGGAYVKTKDAQILVHDGVTPRVAIGQRGDGTFGIKVSKPGQDALLGTNDQMVMNSDFNSFKILGSGTIAVVVSGTGVTLVTTPHGLSSVPAYLAFIQPAWNASAYFPNQLENVDVATLTITALSRLYMDGTNIYASVTTQNALYYGTYNFKYYLLQETAT